MATNKKITQLDELTPATWADDDVIAIVDISAQETKKIQLSTFRGAVTGVSSLNASTPLTVDSATGDVTISVAINGGGTINAVFDEDNMASNSPTALATQQSIKAYVDSQVGTVDTLAEILANGNTSGGTNIVVSFGDVITTNTINETTAASGVTIDGVLVKDGQVDGRDVSVDGTKLDTVETSADVTDTANVTAAGALMDSELTNITAVKALDQGVATTDTPTFAGLITAGNVDGRDVSADGAKLDGIEAGADVTDTANVTAAGALMDSELTNIAAVKALNQGVATTDSPSFAGLTATTADINGGTIDGAVIGGASAAAGTFTTFTSTGIDDNAASTAITIDSSQNVGINITNPGTSLDVNGITRTANAYSLSYAGVPGATAAFGAGTISADSNWGMYFKSTTGAAIAEFAFVNAASVERMRISSAGNVEMANAAGPSLLNEAATSTNPTLVPNKADTDTGIGWNSANIGSLVAGGTEVASFAAAAFNITGAANVKQANNGASGGLVATRSDTSVYSSLYTGGDDKTYIQNNAGAGYITINGSALSSNVTIDVTNAAGPAMLNEAATTTNPTLVHNRADLTTGWGGVSGIIDAIVSGARVGSFDSGGYVARQQGSAAAPSIQLNEDSTGLFTIGAGAGVGISLAGTEGVRAQAEGISVIDGVTAPSTVTGRAIIYVDSADGDLKVKFADGHTAVVADGAVQLQETGTWTPVVEGQTTAGTQTYSNQVGTYVRVGDMVTATFEFSMTAKDAATAGNVRITGLPFAANSTSTISVAAAVASYDGIDIDVAGGRYQVGAFIQAATSFLRVFESGDNVATASIVATDIGATFAMRGSVTYWRA